VASSDTLAVFTPLGAAFPTDNYATLDTRNNHPILDYDAASNETSYFAGVLPRNYGGGGITAVLVWMADTASTGICKWECAFERHQNNTFDLDADGFAAATSASIAPATTAGEPAYTSIPFTDGAAIDSIAVGESFRFFVRRDAASDSMAGDANLLRVELRET